MGKQNDISEKKTFLGIPYEFRKPTMERAKSRYWNADDNRLLTPKVYGIGWTFNFYWIKRYLDYCFHNPKK